MNPKPLRRDSVSFSCPDSLSSRFSGFLMPGFGSEAVFGDSVPKGSSGLLRLLDLVVLGGGLEGS